MAWLTSQVSLSCRVIIKSEQYSVFSTFHLAVSESTLNKISEWHHPQSLLYGGLDRFPARIGMHRIMAWTLCCLDPLQKTFIMKTIGLQNPQTPFPLTVPFQLGPPCNF